MTEKKSRFHTTVVELRDVAGTWLAFGIPGIGLFLAVRWGVRELGLNVPARIFFSWWYVVGVLCALYWPVRNYPRMRGHWVGYFPEIAVLGLFGPLALLLGYPL
jgi:hypothetical protein